jgi:hypothetical protein
MAQAAWMPAIPDRRLDFERDRHIVSPRLPPVSEIARYEHGDANSAVYDHRRMSEYPHTVVTGPRDSYYVDTNVHYERAHPQQQQQHQQQPPQGYTMTTNTNPMQYSQSYDIYPHSAPPETNSFSSVRYRQNASSSSSLSTSGYPISPDAIYSAAPPYPDGGVSAYSTPPTSAIGYDLPRVSSFGSTHESPLSATAEQQPHHVVPPASAPHMSYMPSSSASSAGGYATPTFTDDYAMSSHSPSQYPYASSAPATAAPAAMQDRSYSFTPSHSDSGLHAVAPHDTGVVSMNAYDGYAGSTAHTETSPVSDDAGLSFTNGTNTSFETFMK